MYRAMCLPISVNFELLEVTKIHVHIRGIFISFASRSEPNKRFFATYMILLNFVDIVKAV